MTTLGDLTPKRLVGPAAMSAANSTAGTVPSGYRWIVKQVVVVNTGASTRVVQVAVGTSATAANRWLQISVAPGDTQAFNTAMVLEAGETIGANQGTGTDCTLTVVGVEQDVT